MKHFCTIDIVKEKTEEVTSVSEHVWYDHIEKKINIYKCSALEHEFINFEMYDGPVEVYFEGYGWLSGKSFTKPMNYPKKELVNNTKIIENWFNTNENVFDIEYIDHDNKSFTFEIKNENQINDIEDSLYAARLRYEFTNVKS